MKGVYTNGAQMVVVTGYNNGNIACVEVVKKSPDYIPVQAVEMTYSDFYQNYDLCGYMSSR